uniref:Uncharacterized protein n=1 Tax=Arion vulgaris TaxID=1028688 RepID=A0A0B7AMP3_9EUPU
MMVSSEGGTSRKASSFHKYNSSPLGDDHNTPLDCDYLNKQIRRCFFIYGLLLCWCQMRIR